MTEYSPDIQAVLDAGDYAPGSPNLAARPSLGQVAREFPGRSANRDAALACVAGLWLYHDFLDESHSVSQELQTIEGSYWHALMHRREKDYSNAKYWFRRVGDHAVYPSLQIAAAEMGLPVSGTWNPFEFLDFCALHESDDSGRAGLIRRVQHREWELLFEWCYQQADIRSES